MFGVVLLASCLGLACAKSEGPRAGGDGATHWLMRCEADDECGELECLCGVCTRECDGRADCSDLASDAICDLTQASSCEDGAALRVCLRAPEASDAALPFDSGPGPMMDAQPPGDSGPSDGDVCLPGQILVWPSIGCNVTPVCGGPTFDACSVVGCGCDGQPVDLCRLDRPARHAGPCVETDDAGTE